MAQPKISLPLLPLRGGGDFHVTDLTALMEKLNKLNTLAAIDSKMASIKENFSGLQNEVKEIRAMSVALNRSS